MTRGFQQNDPDGDGALEVEEVHPNFVEVYFIPPERSLVEAGLDPALANRSKTKLLEINGQHKFLTIHPIGTFGDRSDFLKPKYARIERITLDDTDIISGVGWDATSTSEDVRDVLENLPSAFTKDYAYGLGLAKPYRFIIDAVEALSDCSEIVITDKHATGPTQDGDGIFYISTQDFEQARVELNKIDRHAQSAED